MEPAENPNVPSDRKNIDRISLNLSKPALDLNQTSIPGERTLSTLLNNGKIIILDDDHMILKANKRAFRSMADVSADSVITINPLDLNNSGARGPMPVAEVVARTLLESVSKASENVSLLITDFEMKVTSAREVLIALRNNLGQELPFPVLLVSASFDIAEKSIMIGADFYLQKPASFEDLRRLATKLVYQFSEKSN